MDTYSEVSEYVSIAIYWLIFVAFLIFGLHLGKNDFPHDGIMQEIHNGFTSRGTKDKYRKSLLLKSHPFIRMTYFISLWNFISYVNKIA